MDITEIRLHKVEGQEPVKAFASIVLNNEFAVGKLRIIDGAKGLFVAMPSMKGSDDKYHDIAFPITGALRAKIQDRVLDYYLSETEGNTQNKELLCRE